jgi:hypothetical protein
MSLKRRGDCKLRLGVTVENIDQLVLLHGSDQTRTSFGIHSKILTWDNPANTRLSKCFQVDAVKTVLRRNIFNDCDTPGVGADDNVI